MTKQKNRSSEQQMRSVTQAAEAVALGTMAGGLALGAVQAREVLPLPDDNGSGPAPAVADRISEPEQQVQAVGETSAATPDTAEIIPTEVAIADAADTAKAPEAQLSPLGEMRAEEAQTEQPAPSLVSEPIAAEMPVAQQISGTIERLLTEVNQESPAEASALPLAGKILESVAEIVSTLNPTLDTSVLTSLGDTLRGEVDAALQPTKQILTDLPDTISDSVDTALARSGLDAITDELAQLPSSLPDLTGSLDTIVSQIDLAGLPSSLLGNDGPAADGGLLSNLFYDDGEAEPISGLGHSTESLFIADMTQSASDVVGGAADAAIGLLGLSYADLSPDGMHPASGGVGGLGLL